MHPTPHHGTHTLASLMPPHLVCASSVAPLSYNTPAQLQGCTPAYTLLHTPHTHCMGAQQYGTRMQDRTTACLPVTHGHPTGMYTYVDAEQACGLQPQPPGGAGGGLANISTILSSPAAIDELISSGRHMWVDNGVHPCMTLSPPVLQAAPSSSGWPAPARQQQPTLVLQVQGCGSGNVSAACDSEALGWGAVPTGEAVAGRLAGCSM